MNQGLKACYDAFERLKEGKATKDEFKDLEQHSITPNIVGLEAGHSAGYLKRNREQHKTLIAMIDIHADDHKSVSVSKGAQIVKAKKAITEAKSKQDKAEEMLEAALGRELQMYHRLKEAEEEVILLKKELAERSNVVNFPI